MSRTPRSQGQRPTCWPSSFSSRAKIQIPNAPGFSPPPPRTPSQVTLKSPYHADLLENSLKPNLLLLKPPGYTDPAVLPGLSFWTLLPSQGQSGPQAGPSPNPHPGPPCSARKGALPQDPRPIAATEQLSLSLSAATLPSSCPNSSEPLPRDHNLTQLTTSGGPAPGDVRGLSLRTLPEEELEVTLCAESQPHNCQCKSCESLPTQHLPAAHTHPCTHTHTHTGAHTHRPHPQATPRTVHRQHHSSGPHRPACSRVPNRFFQIDSAKIK